jgi:hypothetical protein
MDSQKQKIKDKLNDPWWRLNNLYWIQDDKGKKVKFKPNWAQKFLYNNMWFLCIILKARQLGFTTFIQIFMLDRCLFNDNISAGVVAQNREAAEDFFNNKIKFAYDNLPDWIKVERGKKSDSARKLEFSNGSKIVVGTSLRSGTYQYLHISEFGKICATRPDRAQEIIAGSINTVASGCFIFIESTGEGAYGAFYDMCMDALATHINELTELDFKFFFFPWWKHAKYILDASVAVSEEDGDYFSKIEAEEDIELTDHQKAWYIKKKKTQKGKMTQEYPSNAQEAFETTSEHAVYGAEFRKLREQGRIKDSIPVDPNLPVHTFWDLGQSKTDSTCLWFMQEVRGEYNFIDYYQETQKPVGHFASVLTEKGYNYGTHYIPHDGNKNDATLVTYKDRLVECGINATKIRIVPRTPLVSVGVDQTRQKFPFCNFDKSKCGVGLAALERYENQYDEKKGAYVGYNHNWASHPSDAFRQFGQDYNSPVEHKPLPKARKRHRA